MSRRLETPGRVRHILQMQALLCVMISAGLLVPFGGCSAPEEKRTEAEAPAPRHLLLITIDTLRPDYLSFNQYDRPTSPFLDSLMAKGTVFTHAVTPIPRTTPALATMLTGCYPHTTKVRTLTDTMAGDVLSLAELAKAHGYTTQAVVSNHVLPPRRGLNRGFDVYDFATDRRDAEETTAAMIQYLGWLNPEYPIFAWIHYIDPHVPYYPPESLAREFDPGYEGRYRDHFGGVKGGIGDKAYPDDLPKETAVFQNPLPDEVNAHIRRLYAADIRYTDDAIGKLVRWVQSEMGGDWIIVMTSDHGESLGEHDYFYDHGDYVYNAELRIPLFILFPEADPFAGFQEIGDWVSLVDLMPTLAELLGMAIPPDLRHPIEGRSLLPAIRGEDFPARVCFAECGESHFPEMIRRRKSFDVAGRFRSAILGAWKLIWTPGAPPETAFELYHLAEDPGETRNLFSERSSEARGLARELLEWTVVTDDRQPMSEEDRELLRSLGYIK